MKNIRYIIYGAGAIGSCYGGLLSRLGRQVILVGKPNHVSAIQQHGLVIKCINETLTIPVDAVSDIHEISPSKEDLILLAVKSQQTLSVMDSLKNHFGENIPIVAFQNGVRNEEHLSKYFKNVYSALVNFNANFLSPGVVQRTILDQIVFGKYPVGIDEITNQLSSDAQKIGFESTEHDAVMNLKWNKLLSNLNNATLALQDLWLQKAVNIPENIEFMIAVIEEGVSVLKAAGINFFEKTNMYDIQDQINSLRNKLKKGTALSTIDIPEHERSYSSTWQDLKLRRPITEVDWLNGEIVRLGEIYKIPTPYNSTLVSKIKISAAEKAGPGKYSLEELLKEVMSRKNTRSLDTAS